MAGMNLTDAGLKRRFGLVVPGEIARFLRAVRELAGSDDAFVSVMDQVTGCYLGGPEDRGDTTPAELFPFARPGEDGIHFGWVVHREAEGEIDYPVAQLCPADSDGAFLVGATTREALEVILSSQLASAAGEDAAKIEQLAKILGYEVSKSHPLAGRVHLEVRERVVPAVPAGWRFMTTIDGVGVLAEAAMFDPEHGEAYTAEAMPELEEFQERAAAALKAGYAASALVHLRNYVCDPPAWEDYGPLMVKIYKKLGRPLLAKACKLRSDEG